MVFIAVGFNFKISQQDERSQPNQRSERFNLTWTVTSYWLPGRYHPSA